MSREVRVAVFRPDDGRLADAVEFLDSLGATPVPDSMLAVEPTGQVPRDADYVVFTASTGVEIAAEAGWEPGEAILVTIGPSTAEAAEEAGWTVDLVPEEYSSAGLADRLADEVTGATVELARSDHGSEVLPTGLREAGAEVHETHLYRLVRPEGSGESTEAAAAGDLAGAVFTSPMTVSNFVAAAAERGVEAAALAGLDDAVVGVIGGPTQERARELGVPVDVVPEDASFEELAAEVVERAAPTYHE